MYHHVLESRLCAAVAAVVPSVDPAILQVQPASEARFGDYQSNSLMLVAKAARLNPRQLAADVVARLEVSDCCGPVEIAGPGFLNFRLTPRALAGWVEEAASGRADLVPRSGSPRTVVLDFSSPNVAKPMHVGHIRSTGIGDALQRLWRLLGHRVISDNHIGDWGTQFGKLLVGWKELLDRPALERDPIAEMERLYKAVNTQCDADPARLEAARQELVRLQAGDPENLAIWREMIRLSQVQFDTLYGRLGVRFDHTLGESFYNPGLGRVVDELLAAGIARTSDGAVAVFSDRTMPPKEDPFLVSRDGEWVDVPALIRKSDGGFNYMTTDLATVDHRLRTWAPDEILYVVDDRQSGHFRALFHVFARWQPEACRKTRLRHIGFGKILGDDGKPFKTRSGDTVRLADVLDEAEERALQVVTGKRPDLPEAERREIARIVGIGAVKWQDLLPNRQSDYVFSWDKMLALQGNTAPYVQYQYTRAAKVVRDAGEGSGAVPEVVLNEPAELALARHLMNLGYTLEAAAQECRPNYLCNYLHELAGLYSAFYEACPVLKASEPARSTRLALCRLSARVLRLGLETLGIEVTEKM
ncbi:MAG: arginine--tRNA ligase [Verrucomicrobia bacterium]|nr:arginine--tRNA ligase [Verrucomicrobiota bacterium]